MALRICNRLRRTGRTRGQSLAEFALIVPVFLLLTLIAIDFGRVYLGWVNLQNMARVAANYAANNPTAWALNDTAKKQGYQDQILNDAKANNCELPKVSGVQVAPDPSFSPDTNIGSTAVVQLTCSFRILTPFISNVIGSGGNLSVSASSTFPIKTGLFAIGGGGGGPVAPTVLFTGNPVSIVEGASVQFTDNSGGVPTDWLWDFGDTTTSTSQNPLHKYLLAGTYTVSLTASNATGSNTLTKSLYITVNVAPAATFTATPTSGDRPLTVQFTDTSMGSPTAWAWDFGDGSTSTAQNPLYTYLTAGSYTVSLTVTTAFGSVSTTQANFITVNVGTCTVPNFVSPPVKSNNAQAIWAAAGFTVPATFTGPSGNRDIVAQSLVAGATYPCDTPIILTKKP